MHITSFMDWNTAERLLQQMTRAYTQDSLRKVTFDKTIYPLLLRFENGDRSLELRDAIVEMEKNLMKDIQSSYQEECKGFFINPLVKPSHADILHIVGNQVTVWSLVSNLLKDDLRLRANLQFYESVGWVQEFSKSKKVKIMLIPDKDSFKVTIPSVNNCCWNIDQNDDIKEIYQLIYKYLEMVPKKYRFSEVPDRL